MTIGPCGIACTLCRFYVRGLCEGCVRGDLCPPERAAQSSCPILRCAAARNIPYCARDCSNFPCAHFERRFPRCWSDVTARHHDEQVPAAYDATVPAAEPTTQRGLRIRCLGTFRVYRDGTEIQDDEWGQGRGPTLKIKALLAYLVAQGERGARKETLIDLLWPEQTDYERTGASFHLALHCLRRALEPNLRAGAPSTYVRFEDERYRFIPEAPCWVDANAFETYCRRAREAKQRDDTETAMFFWGMALDVYGGEYMAGIPVAYTQDHVNDWCVPRRRRLRELYLTALLEMARYHRESGEYTLCVEYARETLDVDPAFEPAHRLAMQCLIAGGQPESAVHQYRICTADLEQYENRPPSKQTRQLYEQLVEPSSHH